MPTRTGTYGGLTADQRRTERRGRLVDAAAEIWDADGWAAVSMRGVCARAGLIDRYFYESFADRDALLVAVWESERDRVVTLILDAAAGQPPDDLLAQLRAAVTAVIGHAARSPRRARIVLGDNVGSAALENARSTALQLFTELLVQIARPHLVDTNDRAFRMTTLMGVGGFVELVTAWQQGLVDASPETIIEHVLQVGATLMGRHLVMPRRPAS